MTSEIRSYHAFRPWWNTLPVGLLYALVALLFMVNVVVIGRRLTRDYPVTPWESAAVTDAVRVCLIGQLW